jgi:hypothetical protein
MSIDIIVTILRNPDDNCCDSDGNDGNDGKFTAGPCFLPFLSLLHTLDVTPEERIRKGKKGKIKLMLERDREAASGREKGATPKQVYARGKRREREGKRKREEVAIYPLSHSYPVLSPYQAIKS